MLLIAADRASASDMPKDKEYTNSIGMKLMRIEPGKFRMGQVKTPLPSDVLPIFRGRGLFDSLKDGDYDEKPTHTVRISKGFYMGAVEVTNYQYELFDPEHRKLRGKEGFSVEDNEAVVFVNWYEAQAFCKWLSDKEGLPYRLPTEAEWEYACRAGTNTNYHTGDVLSEDFIEKQNENGGTTTPTSLAGGTTPANAWGLYDMHGNVEEWCYDWYGPYVKGRAKDPVGRIWSDFRVTRGGSQGAYVYYLRSANRMGAIPESRNWVTGFRVVIGPMPKGKPLPILKQRHQSNVVARDRAEISRGPDPDKAYFRGPRRFVNMPAGSEGPTHSCHNHCPAIVECPNGDLITCWYTCADEHGRELSQAGSRLRWGDDQWEQASLFHYVPDRNNHSPALWYDDNETIYHIAGVSAAMSRGRSAMVMRTSKDSGATWSASRLILPEFISGQLPSESMFMMNDGTIAFTVDGPNTIYMSSNKGLTWYNPGGDIPGIHVGATQLSNGNIFALSRGGDIDGKMPISISSDGSKNYEIKASDFPGIGGGQRLTLFKLRSGELFVASFTSEKGHGIEIEDVTGNKRVIKGLFAAMSLDDGKTWPYRRLVTDDGPSRTIECTDGAAVTMSGQSSEYRGYLSGCEGIDGTINIITSRNHFAFNKKWLMTRPPALAEGLVRVKSLVETFDGPDFDNPDWFEYKGAKLDFNGKGQLNIESGSHYNGINRLVGTGSFDAEFRISNIHYNPQGSKISEGVTLGFRDPMAQGSITMFFWVKLNAIVTRVGKQIDLASPPKSARVRFTYNEKTLQWRIFYGLNGAEPVTELAESKKGIFWRTPTSESLAAYVMMSQGNCDLDHFEIRATE
jgi:formylglycine-generating enzyme required for sulfatase activity